MSGAVSGSEESIHVLLQHLLNENRSLKCLICHAKYELEGAGLLPADQYLLVIENWLEKGTGEASSFKLHYQV